MNYEYAILGGGPAGIMAVITALNNIFETAKDSETALRNAKKICWLDPKFNVGAFGEEWANVPGNTASSIYRNVYAQMSKVLEKYNIPPLPVDFDLYKEADDFPSLLRTAAEPLAWMTKQLLQLVTSIKGRATQIKSTSQGVEVYCNSHKFLTKRCVIAIGGKPKSLDLAPQHRVKEIPMEIVLNPKLLKDFIVKHPELLKSPPLVQGSSHSAALIVMNLYHCGIKRGDLISTQPYKYYSKEVLPNGQIKISYENTGLKGSVAKFTRDLEAGKFVDCQWSHKILAPGEVVDYAQYQHIITAIGMEAVDGLLIDGVSSAKLKYDLASGDTGISGIFVATGVGHPVQAKDGSKNVGLGKFWPDMQHQGKIWQKRAAEIAAKTDFFLHSKDRNILPLPLTATITITSRL